MENLESHCTSWLVLKNKTQVVKLLAQKKAIRGESYEGKGRAGRARSTNSIWPI